MSGLASPERDLIVHSMHPLNAEPPLHRLRGDFITRVADFYIRSHGDMPGPCGTTARPHARRPQGRLRCQERHGRAAVRRQPPRRPAGRGSDVGRPLGSGRHRPCRVDRSAPGRRAPGGGGVPGTRRDRPSRPGPKTCGTSRATSAPPGIGSGWRRPEAPPGAGRAWNTSGRSRRAPGSGSRRRGSMLPVRQFGYPGGRCPPRFCPEP